MVAHFLLLLLLQTGRSPFVDNRQVECASQSDRSDNFGTFSSESALVGPPQSSTGTTPREILLSFRPRFNLRVKIRQGIRNIVRSTTSNVFTKLILVIFICFLNEFNFFDFSDDTINVLGPTGPYMVVYIKISFFLSMANIISMAVQCSLVLVRTVREDLGPLLRNMIQPDITQLHFQAEEAEKNRRTMIEKLEERIERIESGVRDEMERDRKEIGDEMERRTRRVNDEMKELHDKIQQRISAERCSRISLQKTFLDFKTNFKNQRDRYKIFEVVVYNIAQIIYKPSNKEKDIVFDNC